MPATVIPFRPTPTSRPAKRRELSARGVLIARIVCALAGLALWQILVATGLLSASSVASPSEIAHALAGLVTQSIFWTALAETLVTWILGLTLSAAISIPVGLALGANDWIYRSCRFTIDFLRTIPPVALIPLVLLLYGATRQMVLTLIVIGSVWPFMLQSMYGVHEQDAVARDMARSYRLNWLDRVTTITLPSALPFICTGLRIAATMSLLMSIGCELIGDAPGLGSQIGAAQSAGDVPGMYAYIAVCAALGLTINRLMLRAEAAALWWHPSHRQEAR